MFITITSIPRFLKDLQQSKLIVFPTYILMVLLVMGWDVTYAQTTAIEKLGAALSKATADSVRITLMNELSINIRDIDSKQSLYYARKALALSRDIQDKKQEVKAMHNLGLVLYDSPNKDSALIYFIEGERMAGELGLGELQADHLMSLGNWYRYNQGDSTIILNYLRKSVEVSKAANYTYGIARSYVKLASIYTKYKEIQLCEEYLELSVKYYLQLKDGGESIAHYYDEVGNKIWDYNPKKSMELFFKGLTYSDTYPNIKVSLATAHSAIGKPEIALQYLTDAIASLDTIQYDRMMGVAKARLAEVYVQLDDYKSALTTCDDGINLLSNLSRSNQTGLPSLFRTKGKLMELEGRDETALAFYLKSLKQAERINRDFELMRANVAVGKFYTSKAPKKGKVYCELALALAKKNNSTSVEMDACECLFNIYKEEQSYKDALKYFQRRVGLIDSLGTLKVEHALDLNSKIALKDKQIAEQAHQKEIKNQELQNQRRLNSTLFIASIIGFLLLGILSRLNKKNRKQNIEITNQNAEIIKKTNELEKANLSLESSNDELESFAHMASHDLKAPLTTITSFSELLQKKASSKLDTKELEFLNFITSSGRNLSAMIDDILSYSKVGSQKVIIKETDMNSIIDVLLITLNPQAKEKSVTLTQLSTFPNAMVDEVKMKRVFQNIASNAIKFCDVKKDTRYIDFSYKELANFHQFTIADNGIGIPDTKKNLFEPFTYLNPKSEYKGTGMGLAMCEKIIKKHGGKIWYESELGKGTAFHFTVKK